MVRRASPTLLAAALAGALTVPVAPPSYAGGGAVVQVVDNDFTPGSVRVPLGGTVTWEFVDPVSHTTTSDEGFWDSGSHRAGDTFDHTFTSAGRFDYLCTIHPHMRGTVKVRPTAKGSAREGWVLRWATVRAPSDRDYDVQVKKPGSKKWRWLRRHTARPKVRFDPAQSGKWKVRARTSNTDTAQSSGWSPVKGIKVA